MFPKKQRHGHGVFFWSKGSTDDTDDTDGMKGIF